MSKFIALIKVLLKNSGGSFTNLNKKGKMKSIALTAIIILAFVPMAISFAVFIAKAYDSLLPFNQEGVVLGFALSIASAVIFFFGIFYSINTFYFSMDIENLLPLPLKAGQILGAKFCVILTFEYLTEVVFLLPILIAYGYKSSGRMLYYIYGIIIFLTLPIIPLIISSIINMIIMRFTNIAKNKDRFRVISGIITMFLAIGINMYMQKIGPSIENSNDMVKMFSQGNNSLLGISSKLFPSSKLAALALVNNFTFTGLFNLLLFILISCAAIAIFILIGNGLYFKGVIGISETSAKRKAISDEELKKKAKKNSKVKSYTIKELRLLFRTPVYFMNCVLINFLLPIFLLIPMFAQKNSMKNMESVSILFNNKEVLGMVLAISVAIMVFISATNCIAATAISREGKNIFFCKYIPMTYKQQIISKVLPGAIMGLIGSALVIITGIIVIKVPVYVTIFIIIPGILGIAFSSLAGILIDINFPKLNWDTEQKAVKQNLNSMVNMVAAVVIAGLSVFIIFKLHLMLWSTFFVLTLFYGALDVLIYIILIKNVEKNFNSIL